MSTFASQFAELQHENTQLREKLSSFDKAQERIDAAEQLTKEAWQQNERLEKELKDAKAELEKASQLREQEKSKVDKTTKDLSKSIESLLGKLPICRFIFFIVSCRTRTDSYITPAAVDMPINRADPKEVEAMSEPISFAADAVDRALELVTEAKSALSHLYRLVLPRLPQAKTLHELSETFLVKETAAIEVLKRKSRVFGAFLALQIIMGNGVELNFEEVVKMLPRDKEGADIDLSPFVDRAKDCALALIQFADENKKAKTAGDASSSVQTHAPPA